MGRRRPLRIGIGCDLTALDLGLGRRKLGSALAWYVKGIGYLQGLRVGADRIGLDGAPSFVVSQLDEARAREACRAGSAARQRRGSELAARIGQSRNGGAMPPFAIALSDGRGAIADWEATAAL